MFDMHQRAYGDFAHLGKLALMQPSDFRSQPAYRLGYFQHSLGQCILNAFDQPGSFFNRQAHFNPRHLPAIIL